MEHPAMLSRRHCIDAVLRTITWSACLVEDWRKVVRKE